MKKKIIILLTVIIPAMLIGQCPDVLPTGDFSMNFCNFPFAWEVTQAEKVEVGIFSYENNEPTVWSKQIKKLAPASTVQHYSMSGFLNRSFSNKEIQVVFISNEIEADDYDRFIAAIEHYKDIPVILPAYFGPMNGERDYSDWQNLLRRAPAKGAIISGSHGDFYQLGDLSFWENIPVDVFAVMGREIDVIALLKEVKPDLQPGEIEKILLKSTQKSYDGIPILDSNLALQNLIE